MIVWVDVIVLQVLFMLKAQSHPCTFAHTHTLTRLQEEQHLLKKELASLAITLNMEAQKRRQLEVEGERVNTKTASKEIQVGVSDMASCQDVCVCV